MAARLAPGGWVCLSSLCIVACAGQPFSTDPAGAGSSAPDSSVADARTTADAAPGADAMAEAEADGTSEAEAGSPFCASSGAHLFCEDFDVNGVPGKFTIVTSSSATVGNGPRVVADTTDYISAPQSALAQTYALLKAGDTANALLVASVKTATPGSRLRLQGEFSLGVGCPTGDGVTFLLLSVGTSGATTAGQLTVGVAATTAASTLFEFTTGADGGVSGALVAHQFSALPVEPRWFVLSVEVNLSTQSVTVTKDNAVQLNSQRLTYAPPAASMSSGAAFYLGAQIKDVNAVSTGCRVHVDNVLFDVLP